MPGEFIQRLREEWRSSLQEDLGNNFDLFKFLAYMADQDRETVRRVTNMILNSERKETHTL